MYKFNAVTWVLSVVMTTLWSNPWFKEGAIVLEPRQRISKSSFQTASANRDYLGDLFSSYFHLGEVPYLV